MSAIDGAAPPPTAAEYHLAAVAALSLWVVVLWTRSKGCPPAEFLWVTHPHAKGDKLLEQRRHSHRWDFNVNCIRRPIQLVLQLHEMPVLWRLRKFGLEGGGLFCCAF